MKLLNTMSHYLNHVMKFVSGFLIAAVTILVFLQVVCRYFLNFPLDWSEEMASFAFVWMALLGASVGLKNDEHPNLDIFFHIFPPWLKKTSNILIHFAILFMLVMFLIFGLKFTLAMKMQQTAALGFSVSFIYAVLPFSAFVMIIHVLNKFVMLFFNDKELKGENNHGS